MSLRNEGWVTGERAKEAEIRLGGELVRYRVRRSVRARRMSLRVIPGQGLEVVLPRGATTREAAAFVRREQQWVLDALAKLARRAAESVPLADGGPLPYLGATLILRLTRGGRTTVRRSGDELRLQLMDGVALTAALETWYRAEARRVLSERVAVHVAALGVTPGRIAIKDTRSRWGSCSSKGNLNFSWRLLLAPFAVMDYVVAHEVAHLSELNHSPRFWATVEALCPDYRIHRAWLRSHGPDLATWPSAATT
jgi:predicted metal-dependent hydrolase